MLVKIGCLAYDDENRVFRMTRKGNDLLEAIYTTSYLSWIRPGFSFILIPVLLVLTDLKLYMNSGHDMVGDNLVRSLFEI